MFPVYSILCGHLPKGYLLMQKYQESEVQDKKRQRREWLIIFFLILVFGTLWYIGSKYFDLGQYFPGSNSTIILSLTTLNIIILLALLYLTVRNLVKLLFERKKNIMGARLRSKLVLAFIFLSIWPTIILFIVSAQFISNSIERWYKIPIERSLKNAVDLGQDYQDRIHKEISYFGNNISRIITYKSWTIIDNAESKILHGFSENEKPSLGDNNSSRHLGVWCFGSYCNRCSLLCKERGFDTGGRHDTYIYRTHDVFHAVGN